MAMGKRKRGVRQSAMWIATNELPRTSAHPFYEQLSGVWTKPDSIRMLRSCARGLCANDGTPQSGARSVFSTVVDWVLRRTRFGARDCLAGGHSFALRRFLDMELVAAPPDHSTISRTRRLIDLETHREP